MMLKRLLYFSVSSVLIFSLHSCQTQTSGLTCGDGIQNGDETGIDCGGSCPPCQIINLEGKAQKGPFLNGSSVQLAALDTALNATGASFNTQILDNTGSYSFNGITLPSAYATLRVDGFYFNEVCGKPSDAQITLNGIVDLRVPGTVNINTLTHLEKARVEFLTQQGVPFETAKTTALKEILTVFQIDTTVTVPKAEYLDLSASSEADAILIAITSILQGYRSESEFSDLMANIITDMRTDGVLNSTSLRSALLSHAKAIDTNAIRQNLIDRYDQMGYPLVVPNFGKHITNFINKSQPLADQIIVSFPEEGNFGKNILNNQDSIFTYLTNYSLSAELPSDCVTLKIRISRTFGACFACWYYQTGNNYGWSIGQYQTTARVQEFTQTGPLSDLNIYFERGTFKVEYFINGETTPSRIKEFSVI